VPRLMLSVVRQPLCKVAFVRYLPTDGPKKIAESQPELNQLGQPLLQLGPATEPWGPDLQLLFAIDPAFLSHSAAVQGPFVSNKVDLIIHAI
jgi:hypothetical protein